MTPPSVPSPDERDPGEPGAGSVGLCPLSSGRQTLNIVLFASNVALVYLASPVLYVGITAPSLCQRLDASRAVANLPTTAYFVGTLAPLFVAWYFPFVRLLKPVLVASYGILAGGGIVMASALAMYQSEAQNVLMIGILVVYEALAGAALQVISTFQWEVIGRGVSETRRGQALGLAFGAGPLLAVVGSLVQQLILQGQIEVPVIRSASEIGMMTLALGALDFPRNFAALYGLSVPIMALAALLSTQFMVPQPAVEVARKPFVAGIFGGIRELLSYRIARIAVLATILIFAANQIMGTVSLYTEEVLGFNPEQYAGYQNALRFSFKIVAGFVLGWLLTRTSPKAGLILTGMLCLAGVLWAVIADPRWFLISFGLLGAGELYGVYYQSYILSCSPGSKMRRNMAIINMVPIFAAPAPVMFGAISDLFGYHASFWTSICIIVATLMLVLIALPARPAPRGEDMDASDFAEPLPVEGE